MGSDPIFIAKWHIYFANGLDMGLDIELNKWLIILKEEKIMGERITEKFDPHKTWQNKKNLGKWKNILINKIIRP